MPGAYGIFVANDEEIIKTLNNKTNNIFCKKDEEYYYKPVSPETEEIIKNIISGKGSNISGETTYLKFGDKSIITINSKRFVCDGKTGRWGQEIKNKKYIYPGYEYLIVSFTETKNNKFRILYFKYPLDLAKKSFKKTIIPLINKIIAKFKHKGIELCEQSCEKHWDEINKSGLKYELRENRFILLNNKTYDW